MAVFSLETVQERQAYEKGKFGKTPLIQGISEHASISPGKKDKTNSKSINDVEFSLVDNEEKEDTRVKQNMKIWTT